MTTPTAQELIDRIATLFAAQPQVEAIALAGSRSSGQNDPVSDIDLYVYTRGGISLAVRQALVAEMGQPARASLGETFWGEGDEWIDAATGLHIDCIYFDATWMEGQLRRVIDEHQASLGYSTCFWRTVQQSRLLYDRDGWFAGLQQYASAAYPEELRHNIISANHAVLRNAIPAYQHQIERAAGRADLVSLNHRVAGLLASYFDLLFALNRVLHPGEKRLIAFATAECALLPEEMTADVEAVLISASDPERIVGRVTVLLDHLDALLEQQGIDTRGWL